MVSDDRIIHASVCLGEVYREQDTNLSREVAIEVSLEVLARGRVARFERKAVVLAGMNHPNMAIIRGLKITATYARASSEEEAYETTPMANPGAPSRSRDPG